MKGPKTFPRMATGWFLQAATVLMAWAAAICISRALHLPVGMKQQILAEKSTLISGTHNPVSLPTNGISISPADATAVLAGVISGFATCRTMAAGVNRKISGHPLTHRE